MGTEYREAMLDLEAAIDDLWTANGIDDEIRSFCRDLSYGIKEQLETYDEWYPICIGCGLGNRQCTCHVYDYNVKTWVRNGIISACGHPENYASSWPCFACKNAGQPAPSIWTS